MPTNIEWVTNQDGTRGETWNPVTGCTKVSPGCQNCYAERMAKRLAGRFGYPADDPFRVTLHHDRLDKPLHWRKPRKVFVCSMGDLFHRDVPNWWIEKVFDVMARCPDHTFQVLTKRADRMREHRKGIFEREYPHIWLGVTAEDQNQWDRRTRDLCRTRGIIRFVSVEPMLEPINARFGPSSTCLWCDGTGEWYVDGEAGNLPVDCECMTRNIQLSWVIIGCESGPGRRPMKLEWALDLVRQCKAAGVPVFVKQLDIDGRVSKDPSEWPEPLRVREYPQTVRIP